jgi:hypothetical protein
MTDSLERFLHDLHFELPAGLVDRAKVAALDAPRVPHDTRDLGETSLIGGATKAELGRSATPRQSSARFGPMDRNPGIGRRTELVGGIAAVVIAAIVVGTFVYIRAVANPHNIAPALPDPSIKQYQAMTAADQHRMILFLEYQCTVNPPESTACANAAAVAIPETQSWLDDLNQTRPPGRFAAIDGRLRHHLALTIANLRVVIAASKAQDAVGATTAVASAQNERDTVNREAAAVILSDQVTADSYRGVVRLDNSNLLACDLCQQLVNPVSCQPTQKPSCVDEIAAMRLQVETFQDDLVRNFAPASLAAKDERLQADLLAADVAMDAMDSALSAGDQTRLVSSQGALRLALGRAASDITDIASGV